MRNGVLVTMLLAALCLPVSHARAGSQCMKEYESASLDYWRIVEGMLQFKVMFDNYDRLCSRYYPDEIAALQDSADLLRRQVVADMKNADLVMSSIFDDVLPKKVSSECRGDRQAENDVKKSFLATMKSKTQTLHARLERSALTLRNPDKDLKLCRDLKIYKPVLEKKLGPDLANPLLEMSYFNSHYIVGNSGRLKAAYKTYRKTLNDLTGR